MKRVRLSLALLVALVAISVHIPAPKAAPRYSGWSEPEHLGAPINSSFPDTAPTLSKDGLTLYFSSGRPCFDGDTTTDLNIWVAQRSAGDAPWGAPSCIDINLEGSEDSAAALSRDEHWMFFVSNRPGSLPGMGLPDAAFNARDIWVSWRPDVHDDNAWTEPINAAAINSNQADAGPSFFENDGGGWPQVFFTSNRNGTFDILRADFFGDGHFGAPALVAELNTPVNVEARPSIRFDGLELFFFGAPMNTGISDIFVTTRSDTTHPWNAPENLGAPVNTAANEQQPFISADRTTLMFARPVTGAGLDLWVSTREKGKP